MLVRRVLLCSALSAARCLAGLWIEIGDAGRDLATANVTSGAGTLDIILGNLDPADPFDSAFDVDLYRIYISDPLNFSAGTVNSPGVYVSDPQLFLFTLAGFGVYMNDDDESGLNGSQSLLPAGHLFGPLLPGFYYLGIGWWDNEPLSLGGNIFSAVNAFGTNGPGAGGGSPLLGWNDDVLQRPDLETLYEIRLTGARVAVPEPGTLGFVATALVAYLGIRRRRVRLERRPGD